MHWLVHLLGSITVILLIIYVLLALLFYKQKQALQSVSARIHINTMPVLRPVPISTSAHEGLDKILAFVFLVRRWRLEQAFAFTFDDHTFLIPAGFEFDGASIPRPLWTLLSPVGLLLLPGLIHDYGYRYNAIYTRNTRGEAELTIHNRDQAFWDDLFCNIGKQVNGIELLNAIATLGLRLGGHKTWDAWRERNLPVPDFCWTLTDEKEGEQINSAEHSEPTNVTPIKLTKVPEQRPGQSSKTDTSYISGATKTTTIGYTNRHNQQQHGSRGTPGTGNNQTAYKIACGDCGEIYGTNGSEVYRRKCPTCQGGKPGIPF